MTDLAPDETLTQDPPAATWVRSLPLRRSPMQLTGDASDLISFELGFPAVELFPVEAFSSAASHVLRTDPLALQYAAPCARLRAQIVELMERRGVSVTADQVYLTAGAQQGLSLLATVLLDPGDSVLLEEACYPGFLEVLQPFRPRIFTTKTNLRTGIDISGVESALNSGARPKLLYVTTEAHNPLGVSMASEKRRQLAELARRGGFLIIEDDAYGFLRYDGLPEPPIRALDTENVCYVGSFSKIIAPAVRIGWVIVPKRLSLPVSLAKFAGDLDTCTFAQKTVSAFLETGCLWEHIERLRSEYRRRRDAMLNALSLHFSGLAHWSQPSGGVFVWVELPKELDTAELLPMAMDREQVAYIPGQIFSANQEHSLRHCLRLNFSNCPADRIEEGILRLSRAVRHATSQKVSAVGDCALV